jgi:hypothetical protein
MHKRGRVKLVFVMMEQGYTTRSSPEYVDGWLGLMIGNQLWHGLWADYQVAAVAAAIHDASVAAAAAVASAAASSARSASSSSSRCACSGHCPSPSTCFAPPSADSAFPCGVIALCYFAQAPCRPAHAVG